ncbi:MAG: threonylcarbamoyl-AMP synthase [Acidobacteria bacterium]|nr:threonylcarbamoyl-AMP synthase [Acidobacteriota bacterium]
MKTKITQSPTIAARFIMHGEIVAFPTETVYGLGAHIFNVEAIRKIFVAKGRPVDNPLIAHISDLAQLESITSAKPIIARKLIEQFFPGPLTLVLPKSESVPSIATAGLKTIAVRMPKHTVAQQFLRACNVPVVAPSANISGRPSSTTWRAVRADLDGRIGCLLRADQSQVGLESTVVDCTSTVPVVLRAGAVTLEELQTVIPEIRLADQKSLTVIKSPGLRHRHYSPSARIVICPYPQFTVASNDAAYIGLTPPPHAEAFKSVLICSDIEEYAHALYQFFHECDEALVKTIFCQSVSQEGLGLALMDRIERASED